MVALFRRARDPDDLDGGAQSRLLQQYVSQVTSAIRPALTPTAAPALLATAGAALCTMVEEQLLADKTALRRLVKAVLAADEKGDKDGPLGGREAAAALAAATAAPNGSVLAALSADALAPLLRGGGGAGGQQHDVCEDDNALAHITRAHVLAQLYLLAVPAPAAPGAAPHPTTGTRVKAFEEARQAVRGLLAPQAASLGALWLAVAVDAARVLQVPPSPSQQAPLRTPS